MEHVHATEKLTVVTREQQEIQDKIMSDLK